MQLKSNEDIIKIMRLALGERKFEELLRKVEGEEKRSPTGGIGKYWIVNGKPGGQFRVPWLSKSYVEKESLTLDELNAQFPHLRGKAYRGLLTTKEEVVAMNLSFDNRGEFVTDDLEIARLAQQAARSWRRTDTYGCDYLHELSKPIPISEADIQRKAALAEALKRPDLSAKPAIG